MKNTLVSALLFVLLISLFPKKVVALPIIDEIKDSIQIKFPTATPTPIPIKFEMRPVEMEIIPLSTATPTPVQVIVTQVVTVTPKPSVETEISPTISQNPTIEVSPEAIQEEKIEEKEIVESEEEKTDLSKWFLQITIGLLALIIVILIWPKKKKIISDN